MATLKNIWLRAGLGILTAMFVLSAFILVIAKQRNVEPSEVKTEVKKVVLAPVWYEYTGPNHTSSNYATEALKSENYTLMSGSTPSCTTGNSICTVKVAPDPSNPDQPDQSSLTLLSNNILKIVPQDNQIVRFEN